MVSFYANVIMQNSAWRLGFFFFFSLLIGREKRGARRCKWQGSLTFLLSHPEREFLEFYLVLFPPGSHSSHLYMKKRNTMSSVWCCSFSNSGELIMWQFLFTASVGSEGISIWKQSFGFEDEHYALPSFIYKHSTAG